MLSRENGQGVVEAGLGLSLVAIVIIALMMAIQPAQRTMLVVADSPAAQQPIPAPHVPIPLDPSHHPEHSPLLQNQAAYDRVADIVRIFPTIAFGPGKQPSTIRCVLMKLGDITGRWIIWRFTNLSATGVPRGNVTWFDRAGWQDSYADKSGNTLLDVPTADRGNPQIHMEEVPCSTFPPLPPLAAQ